MSEAAPTIGIQGLVAGYGAQALCAPLDLQLHPGQGVGIIGVNGSGKSTVLRAIFDLQAPLEGSVRFGDEPMNAAALDYRRKLALLVEDAAFIDELSVAEHLDLVARGHQVRDPEQAVARELDFFGLQPVAAHLPHELSSGQRRKLMLAAALIRPTDYLVLDEPEQRLDPQSKARLAERLSGRREQGAGLVLVSHDAGFIGQCTARVLLLDQGQWRELTSAQAVNWLAR